MQTRDNWETISRNEHTGHTFLGMQKFWMQEHNSFVDHI